MKNLEFMYFRPKMDMMKFKPIFWACFPAGTSAIKAVKVLFYKSVLLVTLAFTERDVIVGRVASLSCQAHRE